MLAYAGFRFQIMITYNDNSIMQNTIENYYSADDKFNFDQKGFSVAFGVIDINNEPIKMADYA